MFRFTSKFNDIKTSINKIHLISRTSNNLILNIYKFQSTLVTNEITKSNENESQIEETEESIQTKRKAWTKEEFDTLQDAIEKHGKKWTFISKNYFNSERNPNSLNIKWVNSILSQLRPSYYNKWTLEDDKILEEGVKEYGSGKWMEISKLFSDKDRNQVAHRWYLLSKKKRGKWTKEEDQMLLDLLDKHGKRWKLLSEILDRPSTSIRTRYERINSNPWTTEENIKLKNAIMDYEEDWEKITKIFPYRTMFEIKDHYTQSSRTNPYVNIGHWEETEISDFMKAYKEHGNQWKKISKIIKTRSAKQCAKYYYDHIRNPHNHVHRIRSDEC
ncbi:10615_t:CDS:1 [Funneliformis mosseae]|uniref:10615_t:CDS:1 n=1 Tax=Funneliformis mosseae TaxID=27381 RepID=A0A9N9EMU7_FUNMO|nr:10615_t:CDS:1 [Funneliformis mosseae]